MSTRTITAKLDDDADVARALKELADLGIITPEIDKDADLARLTGLLERARSFCRDWKCKTGRNGAPNYYFVGDPSKAAALAKEIEEALK